MKDIMTELGLMNRGAGTRDVDGREAHEVTLSRTYDAPIDEVWRAVSEPDRISRWLGPISGDFKLGGTYQLEHNAGGDIIACEPPQRVRVTWIFGDPGPDPFSEVELRLTPAGADATTLTLTHIAVVPSEFSDTYGPGATGVGWDLALVGLSALLAGTPFSDAEAFESSPEARDFVIASAAAWGETETASGVDPDVAKRRAESTRDFYAPPLDAETPST